MSFEGFMQRLFFFVFFLQKDFGFDRGQFYKQIVVMRGQVSLGYFFGVIFRIFLGGLCVYVE